MSSCYNVHRKVYFALYNDDDASGVLRCRRRRAYVATLVFSIV